MTPLTPLQQAILAHIAEAPDAVTFHDLEAALHAPPFLIRRAMLPIWRGDARLVRAQKVADKHRTIIFTLTRAGHKALVDAEMWAAACECETQGAG